MENISFSSGGEGAVEDIERALMDLGPLLGVSVKEEAPDEAAPAPLGVVGSASEGGAAGGGKAEGGAEAAEGAGGADSLASPGPARAADADGEDAAGGARCVMCRASLALAEGTPKLMECLHSACEPCLKLKIEEKLASNLQRDFLGAERIAITCPACRLQCQPTNMIDQRFVLEKAALEGAAGGAAGGAGGAAAAGEQQCNSCEDTEPATSYCVDCAEFICDNCVHAHQRLKITKDHTIKSKEEAVAELHAAQPGARHALDMFCRDHPQERLSLFCETCDRLTCRDCQLQHHRDHKYQFSTEMAAQARANISSLLSEVSYKRVLLGSAMKVIRDRQQLIADKKKALVHDITQTVVKLTNAINTRGKQLVLRLNEVCDAKQRTLGEKKEALEQLAAITDHCVRFVAHALRASDAALLHAKRPVVAHLQRIKARRADIPNPEIPVRIALQLDKLPDLIRVLSSIGAIVVDGKVDGGAGGGGAQGPYHPPQPPAQPPHSAVMALQHVAMHQSYVQSAGGGGVGGVGGGGYLPALAGGPGGAGGGGGGALRARAGGPLRHAHVTSTTHPHHLHGMSEMNLRGLLGAVGAVGVPGPRALPPARHALPPHHPAQAQAAMQHAYHQMLGAYASNAYAAAAAAGVGGGGASGRRSGGPRTPSPAPAPAPHPPPPHYPAPPARTPPAKWHTPQHSLTNGGLELVSLGAGGAAAGAGAGADFKITLGRPHPAHPAPRAAPPPHAVSSTNPKTPSPSLNGGGGASCELDKVCEESVQDLMATIAKLDSNGVQVVAEAPAPPASPHVHSSTDRSAAGGAGLAPPAGGAALPAAAGLAPTAAGDPNEDWCAVCMDGGELMCCDKCPKVFHQYCHIPTIEKLPDETETWQCLLCVNFAELPAGCEEAGGGAGGGGLPPRTQKLVERVTLELYCQYELSLPFREPVPHDNLHYYSKITRPMCLDTIRMKLQPRSAARYAHVAHFVQDCRLLFRNAYHYNPPESQVHRDAKRLEEFFDAQLAKWLPEYAYWAGTDAEPPGKRARLD